MAITIKLSRYGNGEETYSLNEFLSRPTNTKKEWRMKKNGKEWFAVRGASPVIPYRIKFDFTDREWELDGKNLNGRKEYLKDRATELVSNLSNFLKSNLSDSTAFVKTHEVDIDDLALSATVTAWLDFSNEYVWCDSSLGSPDNLDEFALRAVCEYLGGTCDRGSGKPIKIEIPNAIGYIEKWEADFGNAVFNAYGFWNEDE